MTTSENTNTNSIFIEDFIEHLKWISRERTKELEAINKTSNLISQNIKLNDLFNELCKIIPEAYQFPEKTSCIITFNNTVYCSPNYTNRSPFCQKIRKTSLNNEELTIEVFVNQEFAMTLKKNIFLKEEENLLNNISVLVISYINNLKAKELIVSSKEFLDRNKLENDTFLQKYLNQTFNYYYHYDDIYKFKVNSVLIISSLYDIYSITSEYFTASNKDELNTNFLSNLPVLYGATTENEAINILNTKKVDIIILLHSIDVSFSKKVLLLLKEKKYNIPVYVLVNNEKDALYFKNNLSELFNKIFVWTSDISLLITIFRLTEDIMNLEEDVKITGSPIILVVEDSPYHYSRILPKTYHTIFKELISLRNELITNELTFNYKFRPKIVHFFSLKDAYDFYLKYKEYVFIIISDIESIDGKTNIPENNIKYIEEILKENKYLSFLAHSSEENYRKKIYEMGGIFLNKNSKSFYNDLEDFIKYNFNISHFNFTTKEGQLLGVAKNIKDFINMLSNIPDDSLVFHTSKNHFALWFYTIGEYKIAKILREYKVNTFKNVDELRSFLINIINKHKIEQDKGKIIDYDENSITDETNIVLLKHGAIGGKARGLAFLNTLIHNFDLSFNIPGIIIKTLPTLIIGTDEFDAFMFRHKLYKKIREVDDYDELRKIFIKCELSSDLMNKLKTIVNLIKTPIAVRSSSMLEDSSAYPFSGVFETYLIPNSHSDEKERIEQLATAIKLIYSSVFSPQARLYFEAINMNYEQEKMAVVIQSVVGNQYENYYFPHISGTAQSYNYYPIGSIGPEDGLAVLALGLGQYVVEGEKTFKFSPALPKVDIVPLDDLINETQTYFYAIDLNNKNPELITGEFSSLIKLDIYDAERLGVLNHIASVYDYQNERLDNSLKTEGPRIINFADILKYNYIPLAETIKYILDIGEKTMRAPVEIEFCVDLKPDQIFKLPKLYLLQIKPLINKEEFITIDSSVIDENKIFIFSEKVMGNGIIENLNDIIIVSPEKFNNLETEKIAKEIEDINSKFLRERKEYILIGPGRWGSKDKFIGIPVVWSQISKAKVIVELELPNLPLDPSLGSHFFHNVTAMKVGYFCIKYKGTNDIIKWELLQNIKKVYEGNYVLHYQTNLKVIINGKEQKGYVLFKEV